MTEHIKIEKQGRHPDADLRAARQEETRWTKRDVWRARGRNWFAARKPIRPPAVVVFPRRRGRTCSRPATMSASSPPSRPGAFKGRTAMSRGFLQGDRRRREPTAGSQPSRAALSVIGTTMLLHCDFVLAGGKMRSSRRRSSIWRWVPGKRHRRILMPQRIGYAPRL